MLCEVLALANEHVALPASGGTCSLSDSVRDMAAYSKLTDSVFKYIELRTDVDELGPARALQLRCERGRGGAVEMAGDRGHAIERGYNVV